MMRRRTVLASMFGLAACASPSPQLHSLTPSPSAAASRFPLSVGLEPVDVAAVASRRELVLRPTPTAVELTETDLWAEPLDSMLQRVLAEDLTRALGIEQVAQLPSRLPMDLDRLVEVSVLDFDGRDGGVARLTAVWTVFAGRAPRPVLTGRTVIEEPYAPAADVAALVLALNATVARLAAEIAAALRTTV